MVQRNLFLGYLWLSLLFVSDKAFAEAIRLSGSVSRASALNSRRYGPPEIRDY